MKATGTCITCRHFRAYDESDENGSISKEYTVLLRTSKNVACGEGVFANPAATNTTLSGARNRDTIEREVRVKKYHKFVMRLLLAEYDTKPKDCDSYDYGINSYMKCLNCRHSQQATLVSDVPTVPDREEVVGCYIHDYKEIHLLARFPKLLEIPQLTAADCEEFTPLNTSGNTLDFIDLIPYVPKATIVAEVDPRFEALGSLQKEYYLLAERAHGYSKCQIYGKIMRLLLKGEKLKPAHIKIIQYARKHMNLFNNREIYLRLIEKVMSMKDVRDLAEPYAKKFEQYGFLTPLQVLRLEELEYR
jgi:hypothetical protein